MCARTSSRRFPSRKSRAAAKSLLDTLTPGALWADTTAHRRQWPRAFHETRHGHADGRLGRVGAAWRHELWPLRTFEHRPCHPAEGFHGVHQRRPRYRPRPRATSTPWPAASIPRRCSSRPTVALDRAGSAPPRRADSRFAGARQRADCRQGRVARSRAHPRAGGARFWVRWRFGRYALDSLVAAGRDERQGVPPRYALCEAGHGAAVGLWAAGRLDGPGPLRCCTATMPDFSAMQVALKGVLPDSLDPAGRYAVAGGGGAAAWRAACNLAQGQVSGISPPAATLRLRARALRPYTVDVPVVRIDSALVDSLYLDGPHHRAQLPRGGDAIPAGQPATWIWPARPTRLTGSLRAMGAGPTRFRWRRSSR